MTMKLERSIEQYRNCNPEVIAEGSKAQVLFALQDSRKDILALAAEVDRLAKERGRIGTEALEAIEREASKATSSTYAVAVIVCQRIKDIARLALKREAENV